ncbi:hypothetical protein B0T16DRAFT_395401 [Cercophora newfieldiana]|uniref:NACHT domain-containing protein n=1 Tax=Cercophora newfieldiana TaxID=92897 RepID=A0AA40CII9_9PEZI|nr:hypothetical protein B0T16DRAFT_395401 [Cercophora newfieldiana]
MAVQIINKTDYTLQRLVPAPEDPPFPLPPSSIRIRTALVSLTTNNFSYAKLGGLGLPGLSWWDVWSLPSTIAAPYNDASTYCRISAWGFAKVIDSTIPSLPVGSELYGYHPIASRSEILTLESSPAAEGQYLEVSPHRAHLSGIYNRYFLAPETLSGKHKEWDALMKTLFETGYIMAKYAFNGTGIGHLTHPSGHPALEWTSEDANLAGAVVIMIGASGKTALSFAWNLQRRSPSEKPSRVVAVGSARSKTFTQNTGLFDTVYEYDSITTSSTEILNDLQVQGKKIILFTFETRTGAVEKWAAAAKVHGKCTRVQIIIVGAPEDGNGGLMMDLIGQSQDPTSGVVVSDAGGTRTSALAGVGEGAYFGGLDEAWEEFVEDGALKGVELVKRDGVEAFVEGWDELARGAYGPDTGLLFDLSVPCRVFTWGYDSALWEALGHASQATIFDHAENFLADISSTRGTELERSRPLIFIGHSLGGLLIKEALIRSHALTNQVSSAPEFRQRDRIYTSTTGAIFLGTPHRGSELASQGDIVAAIAKTLGLSANSSLIRLLNKESDVLGHQRRGFSTISSKLHVTCFSEEKETGGYGMVVPFYSSTMDGPNVDNLTLPFDHRDICKFGNRHNVGYKRITDTIKLMLDREALSVDNSTKEILSNLEFPRMHQREYTLDEAHSATFSWLLEPDSHLTSWLKGPEPLFWLSGKAGSGKSTLMKTLFQGDKMDVVLKDAFPNSKVIIARYFFYDRGVDILQKSQEGLFRSLLYDLISQEPSLGPIAFPIRGQSHARRNSNHLISDTKELQAALDRIFLGKPPHIQLVLFIDGLDEYRSLDRLHSNISTPWADSDSDSEETRINNIKDGHTLIAAWFPSASKFPKTKICVSSRPLTRFEAAFSPNPRVKLSDLTKHDITLYVASRLGNDPHLDHHPTLKQDLINGIVEKASGVFLWVRLVVDTLARDLMDGKDPNELRTKLKTIPRTMKGLFTRMLKDVPKEDLAYGYKMFQIVLYNQRSTKLQVVGDVDLLAIGLMARYGDEEDLSYVERGMSLLECEQLREQTKARLVSRCAGLLEPKQRGALELQGPPLAYWWLKDFSLFTAEFLHQTASDFVADPRRWEELLPETLRRPFDIHAAALAAAISLITTSLDNDEKWILGNFCEESGLDKVLLSKGLKFFWGPHWLFLDSAFKMATGYQSTARPCPERLKGAFVDILARIEKRYPIDWKHWASGHGKMSLDAERKGGDLCPLAGEEQRLILLLPAMHGKIRGRLADKLHIHRPSQQSVTELLARAAVAQPLLHQLSPDGQEHRTAHSAGEDSAQRPLPARHAAQASTPCDVPSKSQQDSVQQRHDDPTARDPSIWARAFRHFMESRPELAAYYAQHVESLGDANPHTTTRDVETTQDAGEKPHNPAPTTLQKINLIVKKLHDHREQRQWKIPLAGKDIKVREQAEKLAKFLLWSDPIVKDALSAQPYAALAWSGVSFLLSLLTAGTSQHASMLHGFEVVNDTLVYWHICEETYLSSTDSENPSMAPTLEHASLTNSLTRLYALLIEYQALTIARLSRSQITRAFEKVVGGNEWADRIAHIEVEHKRCREMIDPVKERQIQDRVDNTFKVMLESKEILNGIREALEESKAMVQRNYEDQLERNLLHDLAGDYEGFKNMGNPKRVEGTCEWFFRDKDFRRWRDGEDGVLWLTAGPGCGKSVLAKALVDEQRLTTRVTTTTVAHFFFKKGDRRRMSASGALAALVHQLFTQSGGRRELMGDALKRHRSHGAALATNFSELWAILANFVGFPDVGEVVCVLDALDECDEDGREMLLEHIRSFYQDTRDNARTGKLKFLVTSRPHDGIEVALGRLSKVEALTHIDGDGLSREIGDEINLVIDDKLSSIMVSFAEKDRNRISGKLKSMKHRTYLWLHLTLDIIRKTPSRFCRPRDLENFLAKLPSEVSDAYEQILSRSTDRYQTETLLELVVAAQRPLTLDEANIALTLALADTVPASIDELDPWPKDGFKSVVQNLCGMFVTVSDGKLSLIHQTARDFLLGPNQDHKDGEWKGCISLPHAHNTISSACMHYLRLLADHTSTKSHLYLRPEEYQLLQLEQPFLSYAAAYWPTHFLAADTATESKVDGALVFADRALALCKPRKAHIWAPQHFSRGSFLCWWTWSDLALASYVGLAPVVEEILSQEPLDVDSRCSDFGTALQTAAAGGHESVVRVLLERGAVVDVDGNSGGGIQKGGNKSHGTALRIAAARGYKDVVELLLDRGADVQLGVRGNGRGTALQAAEAGGHADVVELLSGAMAVAETRDGVKGDIPSDLDESESESEILPSWFGHEDLDAGTSRVEMPRWDSAHMSLWDDDYDPPYFEAPLPASELPSRKPVTPLQRVMTLQYPFDAGNLYGLLDPGEEKHLAAHGMPVPGPWLRT